ncbi:hypothetical protein DM01DRAFT_1372801 [Hesseltinella vesiculosa]|uniref:Uncharacterized protein n=1 Tax=Hesseltinella vesiculosa TaxID=101127 RepID=A0A1X2GLW9_9FUNG|nr:hypothetical protein DM01DRAFT_1372801 [Hesseltinella vesiculosa]
MCLSLALAVEEFDATDRDVFAIEGDALAEVQEANQVVEAAVFEPEDLFVPVGGEDEAWLYEQYFDSEENTDDMPVHEAMVHRKPTTEEESSTSGLGKTGAALMSVGGVLMVAGITGGIFVWRHHHQQEAPQTDEEMQSRPATGFPYSPTASHQGSLGINASKPSSLMPSQTDLHLPHMENNDLLMNWPDGLDFNYSMEKLFKNTRENIETINSAHLNTMDASANTPERPKDCKIKINLIHNGL